MTMTTDSTSIRVRLFTRGAVLVVIVALATLAATGCSNGETESSADAVEVDAVGADVVGSDSSVDLPGEVTVVGERAAEQLDGSTLLSESLALYGDGYRFNAVAEVHGSEAAVISGVVVGQDAQMVITSGDATVSYLITADGSWFQTEGGEWQEVDSVGPIERPLEDLASPTSVTILSADDDRIAAVAFYAGAKFGSEGAIEMSLRFVDGRLVSASYETETASISTSFSHLDGASIETPSAST